MADNPPIFLVPSPHLGTVTDLVPEKVTAGDNEWITLSRDILQKRRDAVEKGTWKAPPAGLDVSDDHTFLRPFGAQFCPAMQEMNSIGFLLKWPANAVLERNAAGSWTIQASDPHPFYKYHAMSSFLEGGHAEAISVELGWIVVTPPGVSVLIKNIPNNLSGYKLGINFAEGVIRSDQATVPMQVHAFLAPNAPKRIEIKRGEPMALIMPFRRERFELHVMTDEKSVEEAAKNATLDQETFSNAPGRYKALYVENEENLSPLYPVYAERVKAEKP